MTRPLPLVGDLEGWRVPQVGPATDGSVSHGVRNHDSTLGSVAFDLVDTVFEWETVCVDRIDSAAAWRLWLNEVELVPPREDIDAVGLESMRSLRSAVYRGARAVMGIAPVNDASLDVLNGYAASPEPDVRLRRNAEGGFVAERTSPTHDQVLGSIARAAIDLFGGPRSSRIRECASHKCPTIFLDASPAGDRRWCSAQCAAKASSRQYRERRRRTA